MLASDQKLIEHNVTLTDREKQFQINGLEATRVQFQSLLNEDNFNALRDQGEFRLSHQGFLAALFIHLYRDEPMLYSPYRYLALLVDIDESIHQLATTSCDHGAANVGHQDRNRWILRT